jgi:parallel beta-helix repeat protein
MKKFTMTLRMFPLLFGFILLAKTSNASAQTDIAAGNVSGLWAKANSPYRVNGEITVPDGETLTIEPGVNVIFTGHYKFNVQGRLLAIGTEKDTITFTAQDQQTGWSGLKFQSTPSSNDTSKIVYCVVQNTQAMLSSMNLGGAISVYAFGKLIISNCLITKNKTSGNLQTGGAGIGIMSCSPVIENNTISYNTAEGGHGGGIFIVACPNPVINNNVISCNQATGGAGMALYQCNPVLINNTITENVADLSSSVPAHGGGIDCIQTSPIFLNTILYGNKSGVGSQVHLASPSQPTFSFCDIEGGTAGFARDHAPGGGYNGIYQSNIDTNPLFVNSTSENYRLSDASPCIGAGSDSIQINTNWYRAPTYDFEGNPRPNPPGSSPDIGAFESPLGSPSTSIHEGLRELPNGFQLYQNYPNPFNPQTTIRYDLPKPGVVRLSVYNVVGQMVRTLADGRRFSGTYSVIWDGRDGSARDVASGVYLYRLEVGGQYVQIRRMVLLR